MMGHLKPIECNDQGGLLIAKDSGPFDNSTQHIFFHISNTLTHISTHFFTYTYIKNTKNTSLKFSNQTGPQIFYFI